MEGCTQSRVARGMYSVGSERSNQPPAEEHSTSGWPAPREKALYRTTEPPVSNLAVRPNHATAMSELRPLGSVLPRRSGLVHCALSSPINTDARMRLLETVFSEVDKREE